MTSFPTAPAHAAIRPHAFRRTFVLITTLLVAIAFVWAYVGAPSSASAAISAPTVAQCNALFNGGGQGANCSVVVNNSLNQETGERGSVVTVSACNGSAADPRALCTSETTSFTTLITSVNQCNGSANLGGSVLNCDGSPGVAGIKPQSISYSKSECFKFQ